MAKSLVPVRPPRQRLIFICRACGGGCRSITGANENRSYEPGSELSR